MEGTINSWKKKKKKKEKKERKKEEPIDGTIYILQVELFYWNI